MDFLAAKFETMKADTVLLKQTFFEQELILKPLTGKL